MLPDSWNAASPVKVTCDSNAAMPPLRGCKVPWTPSAPTTVARLQLGAVVVALSTLDDPLTGAACPLNCIVYMSCLMIDPFLSVYGHRPCSSALGCLLISLRLRKRSRTWGVGCSWKDLTPD